MRVDDRRLRHEARVARQPPQQGLDADIGFAEPLRLLGRERELGALAEQREFVRRDLDGLGHECDLLPALEQEAHSRGNPYARASLATGMRWRISFSMSRRYCRSSL